MKKVTISALLIIFIIFVQVMYINYRLEQKLDNIELGQQNILTKVYALERSTEQVNQSFRQALQKRQLKYETMPNFMFTNNEKPPVKSDKYKVEGLN